MKILLATDGSAAAGVAVQLVARAAWPPETEIVVLEALHVGGTRLAGPWPAISLVDTDSLDQALRENADQTVAAAAERLAMAGRVVRGQVVPGRPADVILDTAAEERVDLIVVGSRGHGTIERMLLGSVSGEVVDHASCPVLVARNVAIDPVLLAWDGSPGAVAAAERVRQWPIFAGAAVHIMSVADIRMPWWTGFPEPTAGDVLETYVDTADALRTRRDEVARDMEVQLREAGFAPLVDLREGDAATEIVAAAEASNANLIVMGMHARSRLSRLMTGSVARNVVRHAHCSVLVVPVGGGHAETARV